MPTSASTSTFRAAFGPGLLWAAAAIGVSHLVQSTRAGADAGFALAGVVLLTLVLKYPIFEFGARYAAATGESLVEGYARIGTWALWLYLALTCVTAVIVQVAVVLFTAFLLQTAFGLPLALPAIGVLLVAACALLLRLGRYRGLDLTIKAILAALGLSTLFAAALVLPRADLSTAAIWPPASAGVPFAFLLALAGWMPSGVDSSVWSSIWTLAKARDAGTTVNVRHALLDFRIGYIGTGILAFAFLTLGAGVMYGSGESFSNAGTQFSLQLVDLYARTFGDWTRPLVFVTVITTMFSTALTVIDGFPRAIARTVAVLGAGGKPVDVAVDTGRVYWLAGAVLGAVTVVVLVQFVGSLTAMIDFATTVSFLTAPILGYLNLRAMTASHVPAEARPGTGLLALTWTGLILLAGTAVVYLVG